MATKKCPHCGETKLRTDFPSNKKRYGSVGSWCKKCTNEKNKTFYANNRQRILDSIKNKPKIKAVCPKCGKERFIGKTSDNNRLCRHCSYSGRKLSPEVYKKCSKGMFKKGHFVPKGENHPQWKGGKPYCLDCGKQIDYKSKRCNKCNRKYYSGSRNPMWEGGKTNKLRALRNSLEYKLWRESVYKRDDYTCVWCGQRSGELQADHIKPFADYPELRFAIDNGRTLCVDCHKTTDTYLGKNRWRRKNNE